MTRKNRIVKPLRRVIVDEPQGRMIFDMYLYDQAAQTWLPALSGLPIGALRLERPNSSVGRATD